MSDWLGDVISNELIVIYEGHYFTITSNRPQDQP
jgi:hypothetical protein